MIRPTCLSHVGQGIREVPLVREQEPNTRVPHRIAATKENPPTRRESARLAREERARQRRVLRKRSEPLPTPWPPRVAMYRVTWSRESWSSVQSRFFRFRRNAISLIEKLLHGDDGEQYSPVEFVRLDVLMAIDPKWVLVEEVTP